MVVTESRNTSLKSLSRRCRRAAVQAPTGSACGKACGQAMASLGLNVAEPVAAESGSNTSLLLLSQRSWPAFAVTARYPGRQQPNGVSQIYCLRYDFRSEGIRLAD